MIQSGGRLPDRVVVAVGVLGNVGGLAFWRGGHPWAAFILLGLVLCVITKHLMYSPATDDDRQLIQQLGLVHVTVARPETGPDGSVLLDPQRCRIRSRALTSSWPFFRRAVFAFVDDPSPCDLRFNVPGKATWRVVFTPPADSRLLVRGRAVALPQGYRGLARVVPPPPERQGGGCLQS